MKRFLPCLQQHFETTLFSKECLEEALPLLRKYLKMDLEKPEENFSKTKTFLASIPDSKILELLKAYVFLNGGKRIRPLLLWATYLSLKSESKEKNLDEYLKEELALLLHLATALECIHAYSLVHDDLPSMDNDALRRGWPTVHTFTTEATALLVGDALLNTAYEQLLYGMLECPLSLKKAFGESACVIAQAASDKGMILGQFLDLQNEKRTLFQASEENLALLKEIHHHKTSALLVAALLAPAKLLQMPLEIQEKLKILGLNTGLSFQIKDDLLDVESNAQTLGKTVGKDLQSQKWSAVSVLGLEESKAYIERLHQESQEIFAFLQKNGYACTPLEEMYAFLLQRKH